MIEYLLTPFLYEYLLKAMFVSAFIGGVCAMLSCFVTLKGWSLMGDALSHAIVPGVAVAYHLNVPFAIGAFAAGMMASASMSWLKSKTPLREDAIIGIVFSTFFAAGLLFLSLKQENLRLQTIVLGNVLGIDDRDILQAVIISSVALLVLLLKWKDFLLFTFDPNQARAIGLNTKKLHMLLLMLLAATAIAALQTVGAILVVAMLVTPGATAYLLTDRFGRMLSIATVFGVLTSFFGAYASYFLDCSTGGCIVVLQTVVFLLALLFAPTHGVLASRRNAAALGESLPPVPARVFPAGSNVP